MILVDTNIPLRLAQPGHPRLLTLNDADFRRFVEIATLNPFDVLGIARV